MYVQLQKLKSEIEGRCHNPQSVLLEAIHSAGYRGALANPLFVPDYSLKALRCHLESFVSVRPKKLRRSFLQSRVVSFICLFIH